MISEKEAALVLSDPARVSHFNVRQLLAKRQKPYCSELSFKRFPVLGACARFMCLSTGGAYELAMVEAILPERDH